MSTFDKLQSVQALKSHYEGELSKTHLKSLLNDGARNEALRTEVASASLIIDCTHTKVDAKGDEGGHSGQKQLDILGKPHLIHMTNLCCDHIEADDDLKLGVQSEPLMCALERRLGRWSQPTVSSHER